MADIAAQREARRLKLMKNAENRMNRLCGKSKGTEEEDSIPRTEDISSVQKLEISNGERLEQNNETESTSPYNLRHRPTKLSPKPSSEESISKQKISTPPYEIVDDPEVPSLAEFLASQEAAKTADGSIKIKGGATRQTHERQLFSEKHLEYIRIAGLFVTALLSRCFLKFKLGFGVFFLEIILQSMFLPFMLFQVLISYVIRTYMKHLSASQARGSLLSTALVLCGVKPDLIQMYNGIMAHVTTISNDFFLYIFAFLVWHAIIAY